MTMIVRAFPLKKGCTRVHLEEFARELDARKIEVAQWHSENSISHESWYLQETESGPWVIAINEGSEVKENAERFRRKDTGFEAWFKQRVQELTGVDLNTTPLGPPTIPVYEWSRDTATRMKFDPFRG